MRSSTTRLLPTYYLIIILLLTVIGFGMRLHYLSGDSFWIDEILTLRVSQTGATAIQAARDHPPLTYLVTALSINNLGENEFAARFPSAIAGTLAIPATAVLGTLLGGPSAGLWAAFLLAISPFHLRFSQLSRHYALLMLLSLISYIMLYRALKRPKWSYWLAYALTTAANLYNHYAALVVFVAQGILMAGWSIVQFKRRKLANVIYPAVAVMLALILFLPWVPRFIASLEYNVGAETVSETGRVVPLSAWLQEAYHSFGMFSEVLAAILLIFALLGLLFWFIGREWLNLGFVLSGLILPLLLILLFQVARGALTRYIIFMLPIYLVSAGYGIHSTLRLISDAIHHRGPKDVEDIKGEQKKIWDLPGQFGNFSRLTRHHAGSIAYAVGTIAAAIVFLFVARPILQDRYRTVYHDWRSLAQFIQSHVDGEIVLVTEELNPPNYLDKMSEYLPYYLDKVGLNYQILVGSSLTTEDINLITNGATPIWTIIYDQNGPPVFKYKTLEVRHFPTDLYVVHELDKRQSSLDQVINIYDAIVPRTDTPKPRCYLQRDLALLALSAKDYDKTHESLINAVRLCPNLNYWTLVPIYEGLLLDESSDQRSGESIAIARDLLTHDPKNEIALDYFTYYDFLELFESGEGQVLADDSPEPVQIKRFVMPQDGDWGDVLFLHPPASVLFDISLPEEPVTFSSRIALDPESWPWGGDGVTFIIRIKAESGEEKEVFRQHVGNDPEGQMWHEVRVPLNDYSGQDVILTLATEVGPAGDGTGDWAGWEKPRIMKDLPD